MAAAVSGVTASLPFELVRSILDSLSSDGEAASFTPELHRTLRIQVWGITALATIAAIVVHRNHARVSAGIASFPSETRQFLQDVRASAKAAFADMSGATLVTLVVCIGTGVTLRLFYIDAPLAHDEATAVIDRASLPFVEMITSHTTRYQPLSVLSVFFSIRAFGWDEWAIRLPTLVLGIALLPMVYWAGVVLFSRRAGLVATAICAIAWPLVTYSVIARGYALANVFFIVAVALTPYMLRTRNSASIVLSATLLGLSTYAVQSMVFGVLIAVVFVGLYFLIERSSPSALKSISISMILGVGATLVSLVLYSPFWLKHGFRRLTTEGFVLEGQHELSLITYLGRVFFDVVEEWSRGLPLWVSVILAVAVLVGLATNKRSLLLAGVVFLSFLPLPLVAGAEFPPPRIWQFLLPVFAMIAGVGIDLGTRRLAVYKSLRLAGLALVSVTCLFVGIGLWTSNSVVDKASGRPVVDYDLAEFAADVVKPGDVLIGRVIASFQYRFLRRIDGRALHIEYLPHMRPTSGQAMRICPGSSSVVSVLARRFTDPATRESKCVPDLSFVYVVTTGPLAHYLKRFDAYGMAAPAASRADLVYSNNGGYIYRFDTKDFE